MLQNYGSFNVGDHVSVSNGQPQPPARFTRKMKAWADSNYSGVVEEILEPRPYAPDGTLVLSRDDMPDGKYGGVVTFRFHVALGGSKVVSLIPEGWAEAGGEAA